MIATTTRTTTSVPRPMYIVPNFLGLHDCNPLISTSDAGLTLTNPPRRLHWSRLTNLLDRSAGTAGQTTNLYYLWRTSFTLSMPSSTFSSTLPTFSLTSPAWRSALPSDFRSLFPVRSPAASFALPFIWSVFPAILFHLLQSRDAHRTRGPATCPPWPS